MIEKSDLSLLLDKFSCLKIIKFYIVHLGCLELKKRIISLDLLFCLAMSYKLDTRLLRHIWILFSTNSEVQRTQS